MGRLSRPPCEARQAAGGRSAPTFRIPVWSSPEMRAGESAEAQSLSRTNCFGSCGFKFDMGLSPLQLKGAHVRFQFQYEVVADTQLGGGRHADDDWTVQGACRLDLTIQCRRNTKTGFRLSRRPWFFQRDPFGDGCGADRPLLFVACSSAMSPGALLTHICFSAGRSRLGLSVHSTPR